ncbi:hypothetical protein [Arthrobacter sp. zg-Y769]|uniref:hypothetical protein n=1 Tax=Arthrobacter sp. zg-Y769 TaxID=2894191 RepID=UPI001E387DD2|nr:hypothetical protein [Arthrobacter sp. zg-Y769]MCC9205222.1 hypothetical protein [Arthrobacter sp. zg-Y769]
MRLHHVQVSIPKDGEDQARRFYGEALGLTEVEKPPSLAGRLEELGARLSTRGFEVSWTDRLTLEGYERFHCKDPFGNRVEILSPSAG